MSEKKELTPQEETQRLLDIISDIEEKLGLNAEDSGGRNVMLTETEKISLERLRLRLSEIEKIEKNEIQRLVNDSINANEGIFQKEQYREIKKEE